MSLAKYLLIVAREDDPEPRHPRHPRVLPPPAGARRLGDRPALPDPDDDRHARLFRPRPEPGLEGRDRRRRPERGGRCRPSCPPACGCPTASATRGSRCPACSRSQGPTYRRRAAGDRARFCRVVRPRRPDPRLPADRDRRRQRVRRADAERNFLWVTFTRSNPAADIDGIGAFIDQKHWGCTGPLVIDARIKPHHAPPLVDDPEIERRVDRPGRARRAVARDLLTQPRLSPYPGLSRLVVSPTGSRRGSAMNDRPSRKPDRRRFMQTTLGLGLCVPLIGRGAPGEEPRAIPRATASSPPGSRC